MSASEDRPFHARRLPGPGLTPVVDLRGVGGEGAVVLDDRTARLLAEAEHERLEFIAESGIRLESSLRLDEILANVVSLALPRLGEACSVHLRIDARLVQVAEGHVDEHAERQLRERREPIDARVDGLLWEVLGRGATSSSTAADPRWADETALVAMGEVGISSVILVPLLGLDAAVGVLVLGLAGERAEAGPACLDTIREFGRRVAMAVVNANRYAEVEAAQRRFEAVARTLQRTLVPATLPAIPGVELAARYHSTGDGTAPGGDFYDVFHLPAEAWGIVLGDVCGKGVEAAVLTALTRYTVRGAAVGERRPARVLHRVNEVLLGDAQADRFCTVVYGRLRLVSGGARFTLSLSGHPPPLLLRADGGVARVGSPGMPVGVFETLEVSEEVVYLDPGDTLVFYTDGVTEARNSGDWYGEERLASLIATQHGGAASIADAVAADVLAFSGGILRDDMALLVVRLL
jgi:serine phosphatase RsbU (regulator of sigma subunit)